MKIGPLSFFERMHSNGKDIDSILIASLHWPWSITWRWVFVRSPWYRMPGKQGVSLVRTYRGRGFNFRASFNAPFLGHLSIQTQPNMLGQERRRPKRPDRITAGDLRSMGLEVPDSILPEHQADSARRLAACWNACEGMTIEQLEGLRLPVLEHLCAADQHAAELQAELASARALANDSAARVAQAPGIQGNHYDLMSSALEAIKQSYAPEHIASHSVEEYVENAVMQLVEAGWSPAPSEHSR
jgi:hypothetical protein